jgi:hypothetical protein
MSSRLQIRRVHAQYLVPGQHPAPWQIKDRLDDQIKRSLSQTLAGAFSSWFSEADSSLWFIRQLDIDLAVNAAREGEGVTKTFTTHLGRALGDTLQESADQNNVVRFTSPADYLAHFLSDLAAGDAWGRWYYESFFGLRMLPTSAALRTAVCRDANVGEVALLQLPRKELMAVLRALNRQDARLILEALTETLKHDERLDANQTAWSIVRLMDSDLVDGLNEWVRALSLYLCAAREKETGLEPTNALFKLLRCSPDQLREVAAELDTAQARATVSESERRYTSFGGAFLLFPLLDELPLSDALHDWPHADEAAAISLFRLLLLVKCAGPKHSRHCLTNSLLRDLLLVPPTVSAEVLNEWQGGVTRTHVQNALRILDDWQRSRVRVTAVNKISYDESYLVLPEPLKFWSDLDDALSLTAQDLLRSFAWRLPGFAESDLPYLSSNFLDFPASVEEEPTRRVVRLSGPPLRLVLGISGMTRQTYRLSWLDERPLTLFEES